MSSGLVSIDGEIMAPERAMVSVFDRGFLYGDGLFEILRTWRGVAVDLDAHLARLATSAGALRMRLPAELRAWTVAAIDAAAAAPASADEDHKIRVVVTRGEGALGVRLRDLPAGRAIAIVEALPAQPEAISAAIVDFPTCARDGHKTLAYLDQLRARDLATAAGADEAIRLDDRGEVAEGATSNVFAVIAGEVATPALESGALPGIVRARVLASCARAKIRAAVRRLTVDELVAADELFATSSLRGVVAIDRLDGEPRPRGPITARLAADYRAEMTSLAAVVRGRLL